MTPDPVLASGPGPQGLNRFSYGLDNPLRYVDPTGFTSCEVGICDVFQLPAMPAAVVTSDVTSGGGRHLTSITHDPSGIGPAMASSAARPVGFEFSIGGSTLGGSVMPGYGGGGLIDWQPPSSLGPPVEWLQQPDLRLAQENASPQDPFTTCSDAGCKTTIPVIPLGGQLAAEVAQVLRLAWSRVFTERAKTWTRKEARAPVTETAPVGRTLGDAVGKHAGAVREVLKGRQPLSALDAETRQAAAAYYRDVATRTTGQYAREAAQYNVARAEFLEGARATLPPTLPEFIKSLVP